MIRIIHFTNEEQQESIHITDDLSAPADEFVPYGSKLESDTTLSVDLPSSFPMNSQFDKVS